MKKVMSLVFAVALLFSISVTSISALEYGEEWAGYQSAEKSIYKDVDSTHWAYKAIVHSNSTGWFSGYPDGTFRPNNPITRAEAMKVFVEFLGIPKNVVTTTSFTDVKPNDWFAPFVEAGKTLYPDTHSYGAATPFRPNMPITREVAMYALVVALRYNSAENINFADQSILNMFSDAYSLSAVVKPYVAVAVDKKLVSGRNDGTIGGQDPLTRAEFATLLYRAQFVGFGDGPGPAGVTVPTQPTTDPTEDSTCLESDQTVTFSLHTNPSTGYEWQFVCSSNLNYHTSYVPDPQPQNIVGRGGQLHVTVSGVAEGEGFLKGSYLQPWEGGSGPAGTINYKFYVDENLNVTLVEEN